jgi:hypothetical protein
MIKRYEQYISNAIIGITYWGLLKYLGIYLKLDNIDRLANVIPWLLLMWFGCYCLAKLGWDLLSYNDYPSEIKSLEKVIFYLINYLLTPIKLHIIIVCFYFVRIYWKLELI